jgi:hypothetical protein
MIITSPNTPLPTTNPHIPKNKKDSILPPNFVDQIYKRNHSKNFSFKKIIFINNYTQKQSTKK